jgi:hypothetical protein
VFGGHDVNDIDSGVILNIIDACDDIIARPDIYDAKDGDRLSKIVPGWGAVMYYAGGI